MTIKELYPALSRSNQNLFITSLLGIFEYLLEVGEDAVCQLIIDEGADISFFPHVSERISRFQTGQAK